MAEVFCQHGLDQIAIHTKENWDVRQATLYLSALNNDILSLEQFSERFPFHIGRFSQLRKMRSGHHLVFYLVTETTVEIIRILHERQDVPDTSDLD